MKKLLFLLMIVVVFSCGKEKCKLCTTVTLVYTVGSGTGTRYISNSSTVAEECGVDLKKVDGKTESFVNGIYITSKKTTCK
jgi:hypothetical protein